MTNLFRVPASCRVLALAATTLSLAGCESLSTFQMPGFGIGGPAGTILNIESDPPGAEAKLSTGGSCRTPCTLPAQLAGEMTVSFDLPGYQPATVPIRVVRSESGEREFAATTATLDPNPVFVELQAVAPPPPPKRRRPAQRARAPKPSAQAPAPAPAPAPAEAPEPPPPPTSVAPATPLPPQQ